LVHANDWEMWHRVARHGPVAFVAEPLASYRHHADSDTTRLRRSTAHLDDVERAIEIIAERFDDPGDGRAFRRQARRGWSAIALEVAVAAHGDGAWRAATAHAARAVRLDPRWSTARTARRSLA
jgi:hypothetical protein